MRVAAIDQGTNTTRLLVADVEDGQLSEVVRRSTITRLGEGVDERRRLLPLPIARTRNCLSDYRREAERLGADRTLLVATSAVRDAENGEAFLGEIEWSYGFTTKLLSGNEEAELMLRGVGEVSPRTLVLDVGGVGYLVAATPGALRRAEGAAEVSIETYLHVREDALQLYGFAEPAERELFTHLLSVSGIGPKVALAVVSSAPASELRRAIAVGDAARFQAIPGIGKKTAERIVLELEEKLGSEDIAVHPASVGSSSGHVVARDALVEL